MRPTDAQCEHEARAAYLRRVLLVRHALEEAGLCGPDDDEENDGREAALAVIHALARQRIVLYPLPDEEPERVSTPTLGQRLATGASSISTRIAAAARRTPIGRASLRGLSRSSRSQP